MSEIKPMATIRKMMKSHCFFPAEDGDSKWEKLTYITLAFLSALSTFAAFLSSVLAFLEMVTVDLEQALYAFMQFCGSFTAVNMIINGFIYRRQVAVTFAKLQEIYDECKNLSREKKEKNPFISMN